MIPKKLMEIKEEDIRDLIDNKTPEGRQLDYKERLPSNHEEEKKDFLKLVCSFANTDGGDIIYGISDECKEGQPTGLPEKIVGLKANEGTNTDRQKTRLQDIINRGISPQVTFQTQVVRCPEGEVLIIRVEKSWNPPHIVQERSGFFHRNGSQCQEMDYQMIKNAFLVNSSYAEQARRFQKERLSLIESSQTPISLKKGPKIVLHLFPLSSFQAHHSINLKKTEENVLKILRGTNLKHRYNIDGFVAYKASNENNKETDTYVQIFRNGVIESLLVYPSNNIDTTLQTRIAQNLRDYLQLLSNVDVHSPYIVMLSLLEVKGMKVEKEDTYPYTHPRIELIAIDRDRLLLPDIVLEKTSSNLDSQLRPMFDALFQASGWPDSQVKNFSSFVG